MRSVRLPLVATMTMALLSGLGGAGVAQERDRSDPVAVTQANEAANQAAFLAQDLDALMATYADDAVFEDLTFGDRSEGAPAIREMYTYLIRWTDPATTEVLDGFVSADGRRAVQVLQWRGTSGATQRPFDLPILVLHEYRHGRIVKESLYYAAPDTTTQLMGAPPAE